MIIALHKPFGMLSQFTPEPECSHRTLADLGLPKDVYALGRLDADSEGLLLLSDEGAVNAKLLDPTAGHPRVYWAQVEGLPTAFDMHILSKGVSIRGVRTRPCVARVLSPQPVLAERIPPIRTRMSKPETWIEIELQEGKNRQVRRMTSVIGFPTLRLIRVRIGAFDLGDLPIGSWRVLDAAERGLLFR